MSQPTPNEPGWHPPVLAGCWRTAGIVLACVLAIGGLAMVAGFIVLLVALGNYGSNK